MNKRTSIPRDRRKSTRSGFQVQTSKAVIKMRKNCFNWLRRSKQTQFTKRYSNWNKSKIKPMATHLMSSKDTGRRSTQSLTDFGSPTTSLSSSLLILRQRTSWWRSFYLAWTRCKSGWRRRSPGAIKQTAGTSLLTWSATLSRYSSTARRQTRHQSSVTSSLLMGRRWQTRAGSASYRQSRSGFVRLIWKSSISWLVANRSSSYRSPLKPGRPTTNICWKASTKLRWKS